MSSLIRHADISWLCYRLLKHGEKVLVLALSQLLLYSARIRDIPSSSKQFVSCNGLSRLDDQEKWARRSFEHTAEDHSRGSRFIIHVWRSLCLSCSFADAGARTPEQQDSPNFKFQWIVEERLAQLCRLFLVQFPSI